VSGSRPWRAALAAGAAVLIGLGAGAGSAAAFGTRPLPVTSPGTVRAVRGPARAAIGGSSGTGRLAAAALTPGQQIAAALRTSPLYVDPALSSQFPSAVRAGLLREISKAPVPVFILAVPLASGGEWDNGDQLAAVVQGYLGRDGIYLTLDAQFSNEVDAYTWPSDPYGTDAGPYHAADAAQAADLGAATRSAGLAQKMLSCVELITDGQAVRAYQAALRQVDIPPPPLAAPGISWLVIALIVIAALAVLGTVAGAGVWVITWGGREPPAWLAGVHEELSRLRARLAPGQPAHPGQPGQPGPPGWLAAWRRGSSGARAWLTARYRGLPPRYRALLSPRGLRSAVTGPLARLRGARPRPRGPEERPGGQS
jgi:hypothetical protein